MGVLPLATLKLRFGTHHGNERVRWFDLACGFIKKKHWAMEQKLHNAGYSKKAASSFFQETESNS